MARVRGVIRRSMSAGQIFGWSAWLSANTRVAPRSAKAFAVETKVYEGRMTSSPGLILSRMADISSASVHEVVSKVLRMASLRSNMAWHFFVNSPSPEIFRFSRTF